MLVDHQKLCICNNFLSSIQALIYEVVNVQKYTTVDNFELVSDVNRVVYADLRQVKLEESCTL